MRAEAMPIIGNRYDFWMILGLMAVLLIAMFISFKSKKWM
jgi:Mg2+ and Co2+ transporter CorA